MELGWPLSIVRNWGRLKHWEWEEKALSWLNLLFEVSADNPRVYPKVVFSVLLLFECILSNASGGADEGGELGVVG